MFVTSLSTARLIAIRTSVLKSAMSSKSPNSVGYAREVVLPYVVGHDKKNNEFYLKLKEDGNLSDDKAVLQYQWVRKGVVDLYHTGVPPAFRGKGIAQVLAKAAFDYVVETDGKMKLSCTYLQKYLQENPLPQYESRVLPLD